jgi:hypothetical protein
MFQLTSVGVRRSKALRRTWWTMAFTLRLAVYSQSVRLGDKPLETHDQHFFFQINTWFHSPYVTSFVTRGWVCSSQLLLVLASAVILRYDSRRTHDDILQSQIRDSPNMEVQVSVFISSRNRVAQLYPQSLGSLFVASCDSQDYGGGIRPHLHTGVESLIVPVVFKVTPVHGPHIKQFPVTLLSYRRVYRVVA